MKRNTIIFAAVSIIIASSTCVGADPVTPELAGKSFFGNLISDDGVTGTSCIYFAPDGTVAYDERAFGMPATEAFEG